MYGTSGIRTLLAFHPTYCACVADIGWVPGVPGLRARACVGRNELDEMLKSVEESFFAFFAKF